MPKAYINPGPITYTAVIQHGSARNSWAYVEFPFDLKETFGVGNLVPFIATFDDRVTYQGSLAKMGGPTAMILLRSDVKAKLGKDPGDEVTVEVRLDDKPRIVAVAQDIRHALMSADLLEKFEGMSFTHRKEYVQWIEAAKHSETRSSRIKKMCVMLTAGKKSPR